MYFLLVANKKKKKNVFLCLIRASVWLVDDRTEEIPLGDLRFKSDSQCKYIRNA